MNRRSELDGSDESNGLFDLKVELDGLDEMCQIDLNINEYVEDLNTSGDIDWNYSNAKKVTIQSCYLALKCS